MVDRPVAIVPAAGLGTRLLPATRSLPKELLPVGRRTALDWIAAETVAAGIDTMCIVTSPGKADLFRGHIEATTNGEPRDREVAETWAALEVRFAVQPAPTGLGDAVRIGRDAVRVAGHQGCLAILLPDEIHDRGRTLRDLLRAHQAADGSYVAAFNATRAELGSYGVLEVVETPDRHGPLRVIDLLEKPVPAESPSVLAVAGRYLLADAVLAALDEIEPEGGELRLSDAIALAALREAPVYALRITADRFDVGNWDGYEHAVTALRG